MDTIVYLRRSVVDENSPGNVSHEQQLARCRELARMHGSIAPTILEDWGRSGGEGLEHRRSAYQQLRDTIAGGRVSWVVSYDLSRLSRSTRETLDLVEHAKAHGAQIHVGDLGVLDPEGTAGFHLTTMAAINKMYRDNLSKRSKEATMARKAAGLPVGRPAYGDKPGEDVSVVVATYHEAGSFHGATLLLNARGFPTRSGGPWTSKVVHRIVRRVEPASVTAQARVRSRGAHELTGLFVCYCGKPMQVHHRGVRAMVVCGFGQADPAHPRRIYRSVRAVMPWIRDEAAHLRAPESVEDEIAVGETERARLQAKRGRILDMFADGTIGKQDRDRRLGDVDASMAAIAVRMETVDLPTIDWEHDAPDAINAVLRSIWRSVQMGPDLMPVSADWRVPQWRAP